MAEACCTETKSAGMDASKKIRTNGFTVILHEKSPVKILNHKLQIKSPQIAFEIVSKSIWCRPTTFAGFFSCCEGPRKV